ncbi:Rieske 2Fe-2S domain-containing protein [Methylibium sp. T29]|uniref:Rieske 2Fe-2S domain-containing protein n=1 Tax=Methylibium sp. T29 TaxID=1430884 RepID=UPI0003F41C1A|nr:Rieske 2Fe-2S domain-containing protein [Methylibium sp. T29]EWS54802.1 Phenoxybenzoate dioxygenase subunit alpha [Methylibium sp. T29]
MTTNERRGAAPAAAQGAPYSGYLLRGLQNAAPTSEDIMRTGPGTPMGEYMRRYWQPVCLSQELTDVPKAIRIMHEDLVAFRDREGNVGVLHRKCAHRGASLEFGIVQQRGIRCCYHGWQFDVNGKLLEAPAEPADSRLKDTVCQGAYPAFERDGLVFAYMGPPDRKPKFPVFDGYVWPRGTRLIPFSNVFDCNWLQVHENQIDHYHTALLHNNMTVAGVNSSIADGVTLQGGFGEMPVIDWHATHGGNGIIFTAGRRLSDDTVWIRISELALPNFMQNAAIVAAAPQRHSGPAMSRWQVPVDDQHSIAFGWRHFNDEVDPNHNGKEEQCGVDKIDFLIGQTRHRSYDEMQRAPGDYEVIVSQGPMAIHSLEHPGRSDVGVYMYRSQLRDAIAGKLPPDPVSARAEAGREETLPRYTSDTRLKIRRNADNEKDKEAIRKAAHEVFVFLKECDELPREQRKAHVLGRLDEMESRL